MPGGGKGLRIGMPVRPSDIVDGVAQFGHLCMAFLQRLKFGIIPVRQGKRTGQSLEHPRLTLALGSKVCSPLGRRRSL